MSTDNNDHIGPNNRGGTVGFFLQADAIYY